jgi:hypothetical protein
MKLARFLTVLALLTGYTGQALTYEIESHAAMSEAAAIGSVLGDNSPNSVLRMLGLQYPIWEFSRQAFPNSEKRLESILSLFGDGARFEDGDIRPLFHFFDPLNDEGLFFFTSPVWALEGEGNIHVLQNYSFSDARDYLYKALTLPDSEERKRYFGKTFESLGRVIHHLQDMAQPQHVRLDTHLNLDWTDEELPFENRSRYEIYTEDHHNDGLFRQYLTPGLYPQVSFSKARDFWRTENKNPQNGKGIAEFTNHNFVSAGTNFDTDRYPSPTLTNAVAHHEDANALLESVGIPIPSQCLPPNYPCIMTFYSTQVTDNYRPEASAINPKAAAQSIFDQDLEARNLSAVFALNRFNFDAAHHFLIPRAVAYSAGLINYFFRGKMEISLPDEGVYGVVDHSVEKAKDTDGFRKIKLKLRNVTPGGVDPTTGQAMVEPMGAGKLRAVAKFHRNQCYQPDLSGEYGAEDENNVRINDWKQCRSKDEDIVVSKEADVPAGVNADAQPVAFEFPIPIPINATDLYLQVVYRGPLGQENDAVVVATKDIAEPNFDVVHVNALEQWLWGITVGPESFRYSFKEYWCDGAEPPLPYEQCKYEHRVSMYLRFKPPTNFNPYDPIPTFAALASIPDIPVSRYGRLAVLADPGPFSFYWIARFAGSSPEMELHAATLAGTKNQLDAETNTLTPTSYRKKRGIYAAEMLYETLSAGDDPGPPDINPLEPVPAQINF